MDTHSAFDERSIRRRADEMLRHIAEKLGVSFEMTRGRGDADVLVSLGASRFVLECKRASDTASIVGAVRKLADAARGERGRRPLLCVAHMGPAGRKVCEDAKLSWFDLSGNAEITGTGLHLHIEGHKNRFRRPGRPGGFFAPKASRIARWLLIEHPRPMSFRELVNKSGLGKGFVSRILSQMVSAGWLSEPVSNSFRVLDPAHLLAAWGEVYDFDKHARLAGVIPPANGPANLRRVVKSLRGEGLQVAATGLAAAWEFRKHADFRLATVYVDRLPSAEAVERLDFREEPRGANLWIVVPGDRGVFDGSARIDDVECVHPVQVLLDLARHPERAADADADLREWLLSNWRSA